MGQYFLASVGEAEAFKKEGGKTVHFFSAKTLTDSSLNISVSGEEVRGGVGAKLLGKFFHTSNFNLSMTDAIFKLEYIQAQIGGVIEKGGYGLTNQSVTVGANGEITIGTAGPGVKTPIEILAGTGAIVWYNRPGSVEYQSHVFEAGTTDFKFTVPGAQEGDEYCVHFYATQEDARKLIVSSEFVPQELMVLLTCRLFAGDASAPETGKPVGYVTIKVPRFQLDGTLDLSMAMSSAATVQINGSALAYDDSCEGAKYAEIVEFIDTTQYAGFNKLVVSGAEDGLTAGDPVVVYAVGPKKIPMLVSNDDITFTPELEGGNAPASAPEGVKMVLKADETITGSFTLKG